MTAQLRITAPRAGFLGAARVRDSARRIAAYGGRPGRDDLRSDLLTTLNEVQPIRFRWTGPGHTPLLDFGDDPDSPAREILDFFTDDVPVGPGWRVPEPDRPRLRETVAAAVDLLDAYDPDLMAAFRTTVGSFVLGTVDGFEGGSNSVVVGTIWLGLPPGRPVYDHAELMLHEYVHQAVFLEDMVHGVLRFGVGRLAEEDALVTTAILRRRRGYDKAVHSLFVALELARFAEASGDGERAARYLDGAAVTAVELTERPQFLTDSGAAWLDRITDEMFGLG